MRFILRLVQTWFLPQQHKDPGDLFRWPLEILGGENPKRDGGNGELAAPIEYLIELTRSEAVNRMRIGEAESLPIPSVAVEDDANMRRHRTAAYLPKQSAFVEVIEDFLHLSAGNAGRLIPFQTDWHAQ